MKKILSLLLVLALVLTSLIACSKPDDNTPTEKEYSLAIGVVVTESLAKLKLTETVFVLSQLVISSAVDVAKPTIPPTFPAFGGRFFTSSTT